MKESIITIIQILVTILVAFITAFFTNRNERNKQTTVFFKQEGIEKQKVILDFWSSILFKDYDKTINLYKKENLQRILDENDLKEIENISDAMVLTLVQKDSYMYSSRLTIKYIGNYMQEVFKPQEKQDATRQMFLVSKIISNMKYDFTGERTSVMDLLKMRLNDLDLKREIKIFMYEIKYFFLNNYIRI